MTGLRVRAAAIAGACALATGAGLFGGAGVGAQAASMDMLGEQYARLVLALGEHDADYVDAFYGPAEWQATARRNRLSLAAIENQAATLARQLGAATPRSSAPEMTRLRHAYVTRQLEALRARVAMLIGRKLRFDEESRALYDAVAPVHPESEFQAVLADLDARLPGAGSIIERYDAFRARFIIPRDRLAAVFTAAIDECRVRTLAHITLPSEERFTVEYVTGKSWSGYNWYQGDYRSLIQVNTDLPIYIDRAIDLACHEGYPGHHVYNVLLERHLVRDRGWKELSVYPLFSPQSLIAEGSANYGIDVAFSHEERLAFERRVLFPAAGLDPAGVEEYYDVIALVGRLSYAGNEAARRYLDGEIGESAAASWLETYGLYTGPRAAQRMRFIEQYRSYVINYNLGRDLVAAHVESQIGPAGTSDARWRAFEALLASPRLPSSLVPATSR